MTVDTDKQTLGFQTEVKQLLQLMIHSLYSNKEIFLRELVSNAADAADKLRFEALVKPELLEGSGELRIRVDYDKDARTVAIDDNGIGMSREDAVSHLGTIAKSGTADFLKHLSGDQKKDANLIGQFGVGFYSAFIVADQVDVYSRRAGLPASEGVHWSSRGEGEFEVASVDKPERGTRIVLHLKDGEDNFADGWTLRGILKKYSDHIGLPIEMRKEHYGEDADKPAEPEWEAVNRASALWTRPKSEIKDEEYQEFYKHVAHDVGNPLAWSHNKVEGKLEYTSLLFVPGRAPFDLYHRDSAKGLKLYVQRVFIMDQAEQFLPLYLRFIKGVVDSSDLSLNVSREILQSGPVGRFDEVGADQALAGHAGKAGQGQAGRLRHVLAQLRPGIEGRPGRGLRKPRKDRRPAAFLVHARHQRRAERGPGRLCWSPRRRPGQAVLPHRRKLRADQGQPAS